MLTKEEIKNTIETAKRDGLISVNNNFFKNYLESLKHSEKPAQTYAAAAKVYEFLFKLDNAKG